MRSNEKAIREVLQVAHPWLQWVVAAPAPRLLAMRCRRHLNSGFPRYLGNASRTISPIGYHLPNSRPNYTSETTSISPFFSNLGYRRRLINLGGNQRRMLTNSRRSPGFTNSIPMPCPSRTPRLWKENLELRIGKGSCASTSTHVA